MKSLHSLAARAAALPLLFVLPACSNFYTSTTTRTIKLETNDAQAARLAEYEILGGGWRRAIAWIDDVKAVKAEDIQRVART